MAIFKVKVLVEERFYSSIIVEAENYQEALNYAKSNDEWEYEHMDGENDNYWVEKTPCSAHEIKSAEQLPNNYDSTCLPWNGDKKKTLLELF